MLKLSFDFYVDLHKIEATAQGVWGPFTLKGYVLREGQSEEISVDLSVAGRAIVFRLDIPVVSYARKDGKPGLKILRQFEVGSGKASPIDEGTRSFNLREIFRYAPILQAVMALTWVHVKKLISKVIIKDIDIRICLGTGDSASTAIIYGVVMGFFESGLAVLNRRSQVKGASSLAIEPVFSRETLVARSKAEAKVRGWQVFIFTIKSVKAILPILRHKVIGTAWPKPGNEQQVPIT